jgi:hypothetical protein
MDNIFYNDFIYQSNQDYVLGGFAIEDGMKVDFNTISNAVNNRLKVLIEDFYIRGWSSNTSSDIEYTQEDAMTQIAFMIKDNFGTFPLGLSMEQLHLAIMNTDNMTKWLDETIKVRVKEYYSTQVPNNTTSINMGIPSQSSKAKIESPREYEEAESSTFESTLEEYIEQLSLIEL